MKKLKIVGCPDGKLRWAVECVFDSPPLRTPYPPVVLGGRFFEAYFLVKMLNRHPNAYVKPFGLGLIKVFMDYDINAPIMCGDFRAKITDTNSCIPPLVALIYRLMISLRTWMYSTVDLNDFFWVNFRLAFQKAFPCKHKEYAYEQKFRRRCKRCGRVEVLHVGSINGIEYSWVSLE